MWSKAAQKDYLDIYDDEYEEPDTYYEEETKSNEKVGVKPVEVTPVEVKVVETTKRSVCSDEESVPDDLSDYTIYDEDVSYSKKDIRSLVGAIKNDSKIMECFGWDGGEDLRVFAQNAIKRFRLMKLKSLNGNMYYFDNIYNFIWQYYKDEFNHEHLLRPSDEIYKKVLAMNELVVERYLEQPVEFW
jgi:hypothetical protein